MPAYKAPGDKSPYFLTDDDVENGVEALLPSGSTAISDVEAEAMLAELNKPTAEQLEAQFTAAIQQRLDAFAQTRNYDSMLSACTYATSAVAKFKSEGQACVNLRDATWAAAYNVLAAVKSGARAMPSTLADIEVDLPALEWPQ